MPAIDDADFNTGETTRRKLDHFLAGVEKRAFTIAKIATRNPDDALDIVQDAMIKLVTSYGHKAEEEWRPLFYRILSNRLNDWHRKRTVRSRFHFWGRQGDSDQADDQQATEHELAYNATDPNPQPQTDLHNDQMMQKIEDAVSDLPQRQQQAFLFRQWEGMSVKETAIAMKCSEGSVKTHLSRALSTLKQVLQ
ncbi:RNA polymerase sigma factor [Chromatiales bacterium (ex Bugula neritina AB1)]|nr:RNA polymerase sigma factor [Chromatiales bacterium (ex Bugula neritina AB1)]